MWTRRTKVERQGGEVVKLNPILLRFFNRLNVTTPPGDPHLFNQPNQAERIFEPRPTVNNSNKL